METLRLIGFIVYCLAGYWAVNRTIYANYVLYGDLATIFMRKVIVGMLAGPVCIPLAIIKAVVNKKSDEYPLTCTFMQSERPLQRRIL